MYRSNKIQFICDLPNKVFENLCQLVAENAFQELAEKMGFSSYQIGVLQKSVNPMYELINSWSSDNHTILELYAILLNMKQFEAMDVLKDYVDVKLHSKIKKLSDENLNNKENQPVCQLINVNTSQNNLTNSMNLLQLASRNLPDISYKELEIATNSWNPENILGKGGFGVVYKGVWKNTEVAVKRLQNSSSSKEKSYKIELEQSLNEIRILHSTPHRNILLLYAYSIDNTSPCLVYEYMEKGSLYSQLSSNEPAASLDWQKRFEIAKGTALGLQYLHTVGDKPLIHGDIKSANILLDHNFEPKIGDFGLAKEGSDSEFFIVNRIQGTKAYLPEDYLIERKMSVKVDTYSYGIVLFELATGFPPSKKFEGTYLKTHIQQLDDKDIPSLIDTRPREGCLKIFKYFIQLGNWCSNNQAIDRPDMVAAYKNILATEKSLFASLG